MNTLPGRETSPAILALPTSMLADSAAVDGVPYPYVQFIAPSDGERWPNRSEFVAVQCRDISLSGMSFFHASPWDSQSIVVELGQEPKCMYLLAEIEQCMQEPANVKAPFRINCRFIKRLNMQESREADAGKILPAVELTTPS